MNCLRCGREAAEKQSFCDECSKTVSQPLQESPYLTTQILLPTKKVASAKSPQSKSTKKPETKAEKPEGSSRRLAVFFGVLCVAAVGMLLTLALFYLELAGATGDLREQNSALETRQNELTQEIAHMQERMDKISQELVLVDSLAPRYYHVCDCSLGDLESGTFVRLQTALLRGYPPCPECMGE